MAEDEDLKIQYMENVFIADMYIKKLEILSKYIPLKITFELDGQKNTIKEQDYFKKICIDNAPIEDKCDETLAYLFAMKEVYNVDTIKGKLYHKTFLNCP